jgi:hypothetical protein
MLTNVNDKLKKEMPGDWHQAVLSHLKPLLRRSRSDMGKNHDGWDRAQRVYKGEIEPDIEDKRNAQKKQPKKMVVPNTYAQIMTWVSFMFLFYTQNKNFYNLSPGGIEDDGILKDDCEKVLNGDLRSNDFNTKLFQSLLDTAKFGLGVMETGWAVEKTSAIFRGPATTIEFPGVGPVEIPGVEEWQEVTKREGNQVKNVSPYRWLPDTRLPLCDFQRGEFCANEEDYSMHELRLLEKSGLVFGLDHIQKLSKAEWGKRGATRSANIDGDSLLKFDSNKESHVALVTKCCVWLTPKKFKVEGEKTLGDQDFPIMYLVWIANDNRIIRFEPAKSWHGRFPYSITQFTPDMQETLVSGLADLIQHIQEVISWFINSHIRSVNRVVENRMVVAPHLIETSSLDGRGDIYVKRTTNLPLDRVIKQLNVQDVTGGHMSDSQVLQSLLGVVTGVNDNAMGQYNSGRRSASEARVVTASAAGRMKMHAVLMFESGYAPLGVMNLTNLRQALSFDMFQRIIGQSAVKPIEARYEAFQGDPQTLICGADYFVLDTQLAAEKGYAAQSLQELFGLVMSNPQAAIMFDISPKGLLEEMNRLRGGGDLGRFSLQRRIASGEEQPPQPPQPAVPEAAGAQPVV